MTLINRFLPEESKLAALVVAKITESAFFDRLAAYYISRGHAWTKHADEFKGLVNSQDEFARFIQNIIRNPSEWGYFKTDVVKKLFWDDATGMVVIFSPLDPDLGTAFRPKEGRSFLNKFQLKSDIDELIK